MRSGGLTPGSVPAVADAALRDLSRARAATLRARTAATGRLTAVLLRHDSRSTGRAPWSPAHRRGLSAGVCPTPAPHMGWPASGQTGTAQPARRGRLARARHAQVPTWRVAPVVEALPALRGGQGPVAVPPVAARGALTRCATPRPRRHDRGLTPAAYARGGRRQQGSMTPPGQPHARRALGAGAWASRSPAPGRRPRPLRLAQRPQALQASRWPAPVRRGTRERQRMATGQHAPQVVGAMARECRAGLGAMAQPVPGPPPAQRGRRIDAHGRDSPGCPVAQRELWDPERTGVAICRGHDDRGDHAQAAASPCPCVSDHSMRGRIHGAACTLAPPSSYRGRRRPSCRSIT
jgi:transposase